MAVGNDMVMLRQIAIRKLVVDLALPEKVIEVVLADSFNDAKKMFKECNSIEISGFGVFLLGKHKIRRQKEKIVEDITKWKKELEDPNITKVMCDTRREWIRRTEERMELIKKLTHEV
jgi:nucleoid DNA-binding protein